MDHCLHSRHDADQHLVVTNIPHHQLETLCQLSMTGREIVLKNDLMPVSP